MVWQVYVGIGILLCAMEMLSGVFLFLPFGLAFVLTGVLAIWIEQTSVLWATLGVTATALFVLFRRLGRGAGKNSDGGYRSGVEGMVGKEAIVLNWTDQGTGYVKLYGDEWMAKLDSTESAGPLAESSKVEITRVEGNMVFIKRK